MRRGLFCEVCRLDGSRAKPQRACATNAHDTDHRGSAALHGVQFYDARVRTRVAAR